MAHGCQHAILGAVGCLRLPPRALRRVPRLRQRRLHPPAMGRVALQHPVSHRQEPQVCARHRCKRHGASVHRGGLFHRAQPRRLLLRPRYLGDRRLNAIYRRQRGRSRSHVLDGGIGLRCAPSADHAIHLRQRCLGQPRDLLRRARRRFHGYLQSFHILADGGHRAGVRLEVPRVPGKQESPFARPRPAHVRPQCAQVQQRLLRRFLAPIRLLPPRQVVERHALQHRQRRQHHPERSCHAANRQPPFLIRPRHIRRTVRARGIDGQPAFR